MPVLLGVPARETRSKGAAATLLTASDAARRDLRRSMITMVGINAAVVGDERCAPLGQRALPLLYTFVATRLRGQINIELLYKL